MDKIVTTFVLFLTVSGLILLIILLQGVLTGLA
jgi:hypothetical protein